MKIFLKKALSKKLLNLLVFGICLPFAAFAVDGNDLFKHFHFPTNELKPAVAPFYESLALGDVDEAMRYVKASPDNFVGAMDSIKRGLEKRTGGIRVVSISWKSYPQWKDSPDIWVVNGLVERNDTLVNIDGETHYENYPSVFMDVWVKEGEVWKMVPEDFVNINIDVFYQEYLKER